MASIPGYNSKIKEKKMNNETREQMIERWEREGWLDKNCNGCQIYYDNPSFPNQVFSPRHEANNNCESGKHNHCTCDICF